MAASMEVGNLAADSRSNTPKEIIEAGQEPGAALEVGLIPEDTDEDSSFKEHHEPSSPGKRHPSGKILQITRSLEGDELSSDVDEKEGDRLQEGSNHLQVPDISDATSSSGSSGPQENEVERLERRLTVLAVEEAEVQEEDSEYGPTWRNEKKHVFILSEAGKPIYSRHGSEDKLVTIFGVMQALVSFVEDGKDVLRHAVAGKHRYVFLHKEHIIMAAVSCAADSPQQLTSQLNYMYSQLLSILTFSQLDRIFNARHSYDLRRLLSGAERLLGSMLTLLESEPGLMLAAVRCLPLPPSVRENTAQAIVSGCKSKEVKDLVFAIVLSRSQLVAMVRLKRYSLQPSDIYLIINLVASSEAFKSAPAWTPICLPKFDSSGFLYAHVSYLDEECHTCLLLLSVDKEQFFALNDCRDRIKERLEKSGALSAISEAATRRSYCAGLVGVPELRHFLYKSRSSAQYTAPDLEPPFSETPASTKGDSAGGEGREQLFSLYQYVHQRLHSTTWPLKLIYHVGKHQTVLGWITGGFEMYVVFGPLVTKNEAISGVNKLLKWIKREEDRLFILNSHTFS